MNDENLIRFDEMSADRHRELSARGGRASAEAKRRKKALAEYMQAVMERAAVADGFIDDIDEFHRWQKQRDKARKKRGRTPKKPAVGAAGSKDDMRMIK